MKKRPPSILLLSGLLASIPALTACGGQPAAAPSEAGGGDGATPGAASARSRDRVAELVNGAQRAPDYMTEMRREVALPSHRRLRSFLPAELPDFAHATLDSEQEPSEGTAKAEGRYQISPAHYRGGVRIEVVFFGKKMFNGPARFFESSIGDRSEIGGFPALSIQEDGRDEVRYEVHVQVSPEVYVTARGPGSADLMEEAAGAVDLDGLGEAIESGLLFEPTREDLLEATILPRSDLEARIPTSIGALQLNSVNSLAMLDEAPMHCRASGNFATGVWTLTDFGDAEAAADRRIAPAEDPGFQMRTQGKADAIQEADLDVAGGRGAWAWLDADDRRPGVLAIHAVRGRFALEYTSSFQKEMEIDTKLPEPVRAQIEAANLQMGAGAFASIEEQRDAALAAFEALDLEN